LIKSNRWLVLKKMMLKTMFLGMKFLKVASIVLLLTFTATHFSWAQENHNNDDILDLLPGILAASKLNTDYDGDGYTENQGDCNNAVAAINPGATEVCGDGIDQDCSGADRVCMPEEIDDDGDGYTENQGDCSDLDINTYPGATEICGDNIDQDCSGIDLLCPNDLDDDGDGYTENQGDCRDDIYGINPGITEICGDGIDQNCDGSDPACTNTCNESPTLADLAGTWDISDDYGTEGYDVYYTVLRTNGTYQDYDYAGDTYDNYKNCYWTYSGSFIDLGNGTFSEDGIVGTLRLCGNVLYGNSGGEFFVYTRSAKNSFTPICN
jgi:hypothetical protein